MNAEGGPDTPARHRMANARRVARHSISHFSIFDTFVGIIQYTTQICEDCCTKEVISIRLAKDITHSGQYQSLSLANSSSSSFLAFLFGFASDAPFLRGCAGITEPNTHAASVSI